MVPHRFDIEVVDEAHWKAISRLHDGCTRHLVGIAAFGRRWRFDADSLGYYRSGVVNCVSFVELVGAAMVEPVDEEEIFRGQVDGASFTE